MENINKIQIVPDEVYEIGADKAPVIPEWSVKDDTTLLQKVKALAHSTFDSSKFTVVGSPNITDDGIISGLSGSNYLIINNSILGNSLHNANSWKVEQEFIYNGGSDWAVLFSCTNHRGLASFIVPSENNSFGYALSSDGINEDIADSHPLRIGGLVLGNKYKSVLEFTGAQYIHTLYNSDGTQFDEARTVTSSTKVVNSANYYFGSRENSNNAIDLKQFSITVDGVEVFSGNKTGIDTIKPDDYSTSVTPPTITADGIATDLIGKSITLPIGSISGDFDFEFQYTTADAIQTTWVLYNTGIFAILQASWGWTLSVYANNSAIASANFGSSQTVRRANPVANTKYKFKFSRRGDTYTLGIQAEDEESMTTTTASNSTALDRTSIIIEQNSDNTYSFTVDLNKIHLFVDGSLVYQPCLKIPYTEGQNYVKVVDKLYRDRVKDLFEQKGYNGYYTIGEDDFTLPSNKWSDVIEHKENGLTVAEQRVDQTLTIRGACEQGVDVNLPMEFFSADSYAVFGVGTTGTPTASKFTPAADGNYIAIGKGKV